MLGIFPLYNGIDRIDWVFTMIYSSVINQEVVQFLTESFSSNDSILNSYFLKESEEQKLDYVIPATVIRHESEYTVSAALTNDERTFFKEETVQFVPSKCKWLQVADGGGVMEAYRPIDESPGTSDI